MNSSELLPDSPRKTRIVKSVPFCTVWVRRLATSFQPQKSLTRSARSTRQLWRSMTDSSKCIETSSLNVCGSTDATSELERLPSNTSLFYTGSSKPVSMEH